MELSISGNFTFQDGYFRRQNIDLTCMGLQFELKLFEEINLIRVLILIALSIGAGLSDCCRHF